MSFKLVEIPALSGPACKIYSIAYDGSSETSFDGFQDRMDREGFSDEVDQIWYSLRFMGEEGGARIQFFREDEGRPGDGVVALLKKKRFTLRLYWKFRRKMTQVVSYESDPPFRRKVTHLS